MRFFSLNRVYNFMGIAPFCAVASVLVTIATVVALFYPGPNLGTDFIGGTEIEVAFNGPVEADKVRGALESIGLNDADVVEVRTGTTSVLSTATSSACPRSRRSPKKRNARPSRNCASPHHRRRPTAPRSVTPAR